MPVMVEKPLAEAIVTEAITRTSLKHKKKLEYQAEYEQCSTDPVYFINHYCFTFDPRKEADPHVIPFQLYPIQEEFVYWLHTCFSEGTDGLVEKSRDMGATWSCLAYYLWNWLFHPGFQCLLGSRKEDLVDNWQLDSLFGRLDFMVQYLPDWLKPEGFLRSRHRQYLKLWNPVNSAAIIGESANPNFARQGRYSIIHLDEFAFWDWAESVRTGTADAAPTRIYVSTPSGTNTFRKIRDEGGTPVFTLHWSSHPKKDDKWYEEQCKRRPPEDIAQELDISYERSLKGRVYPEWDHVPAGSYPFVSGWPLYTSWDLGIGDPTALVWFQRNPLTGKWRIIDCYSNNGKTIDFFVPFITGQIASGVGLSYSADEIEKVERHSGWGPAIHVGDPDVKKTNQITGTSLFTELGKHGIHMNLRTDKNLFETRWAETKEFIREIEGVNLPDAEALHQAVQSSRFPTRKEGSQSTTEVTKPVHDWTSHYRTTLEFMAVNAPPFAPAQPTSKRQPSSWERLRRSGNIRRGGMF